MFFGMPPSEAAVRVTVDSEVVAAAVTLLLAVITADLDEVITRAGGGILLNWMTALLPSF